MANTATPKLKEFARCLLKYEAGVRQPADPSSSAAFKVFDKLSSPLGKLFGVGGFRSLLTRALVLAAAEVPALHAVEITADGTLNGSSEPEGSPGGEGAVEAEAVLVAHFLALLVTFIGPALTLGLIYDVWSRAASDGLNFGRKESS